MGNSAQFASLKDLQESDGILNEFLKNPVRPKRHMWMISASEIGSHR